MSQTAVAAMQGILAGMGNVTDYDAKSIAKAAFDIAEAMEKESIKRNRKAIERYVSMDEKEIKCWVENLLTKAKPIPKKK